MAQRNRKRGRREKRPEAASNQGASPYSRSEARNEVVRATLEPFAPGERPWPVTVCAILAVTVGGYNLVSFLVGANLAIVGSRPGAAGIILFAIVMFGFALGLWRMRYWAVLGFEALLVILLLIAAMLLITVSNLAGLAVCLGGLIFGGLLFYKLVRALGRMQVPAKERR